MTLVIKTGTLSDFFASVKKTAKEIDKGKKLTPKNIIWTDPQDLPALLKPERIRLIKHLRGKKRIIFSRLAYEMKRTPVSLNRDLQLLSKYDLVRTYKETNPGHGIRRVVEPLFGNNKIEFKAEI